MLWATPETRDRLAHHESLTISAGRLRASRPSWDKILQAALRRAAEYHNHFSHSRFTEDSGGPFRYPITLGEDEDGQPVICEISVRDGVTYVDIDPERLLNRRLRTSKIVFGLSEGQLGLAEQIARGVSLTQAAEKLGISINTARAHLGRIYDKTGVNSQTALVRLLLSVG